MPANGKVRTLEAGRRADWLAGRLPLLAFRPAVSSSVASSACSNRASKLLAYRLHVDDFHSARGRSVRERTRGGN